MSNTVEKRDEDKEYFYRQAEKIYIIPTDAQVESFVERVSVMIIDGNVKESDARRLAFKAVMG
jgi:hypothetical protein